MKKAVGLIESVEDVKARGMYVVVMGQKSYGILSPQDAEQAEEFMEEKATVEIDFADVRDRGNVISALRKIER